MNYNYYNIDISLNFFIGKSIKRIKKVLKCSREYDYTDTPKMRNLYFRKSVYIQKIQIEEMFTIIQNE